MWHCYIVYISVLFDISGFCSGHSSCLSRLDPFSGIDDREPCIEPNSADTMEAGRQMNPYLSVMTQWERGSGIARGAGNSGMRTL